LEARRAVESRVGSVLSDASRPPILAAVLDPRYSARLGTFVASDVLREARENLFQWIVDMQMEEERPPEPEQGVEWNDGEIDAPRAETSMKRTLKLYIDHTIPSITSWRIPHRNCRARRTCGLAAIRMRCAPRRLSEC